MDTIEEGGGRRCIFLSVVLWWWFDCSVVRLFGCAFVWVGAQTNSVSRSDTDTVQVTGVGFDAVIVCIGAREWINGFPVWGSALQRFFSS